MLTGNKAFPKKLTPDEEKYYLEKYAKGDIESKNVLIERNQRLVAHIVKKYGNYVKETEDLISIGTIGLIKAIVTFKHDKGAKLATYASRCIENEILMHIRSTKKFTNDLSLQEPIGVDREGNIVTMEDKLADDRDSVDEQVGLKLQLKELGRALKILHGRERQIIEMRYGLANRDELTQREIAEMIDISRSYVSQRAYCKLREEP